LDARVQAQVVENFPSALWARFLYIASFGGVGAVTRASAGALRSIPETRRMLEGAFTEVREVAAAKGIHLPEDIVEATLAYVDGLPEGATASLQRDFVAGRSSELASMSGTVVRIARELGIDAPVHNAIYAALLPQEIAVRRRPALRRAARGVRQVTLL